MEGVTASGSTATAKETFHKTLDVVVEIFVPVAGALAGFFMPAVLGGGQSVALAVYGSPTLTGSSSTLGNRLAWTVQALINAAVGAAFWSLRHHSNIIAKAIGGAVGGFFFGGAVGCLPGLLAGSSASPNGLIDNMVGGIRNVAAGG